MKAKKKAPEPPKPWNITQADLDSITELEFWRGTQRLLPPIDEIPTEFWDGNIYTRIAEAVYVGEPPPPGQVDFNSGFINDGQSLHKAVLAHIRCMDANYQHRIAGVGLIISKVVHVTAILNG
jgi:hypothetical protein